MIVIALGFIDFLVAILIVLLHFDILPGRIAVAGAAWLFFKGLMFPKDIASIIDVITALYIVGMIFFGLHTFLAYVFAAYLVEKFLISFL